MTMIQTRRRFLTTLSMAGAAGLMRVPQLRAAEGSLETTSVRLFKYPGICVAPHHIAEDLLRAEGFTEICYVPEDPARRPEALARAKVDFGMDFATSWVSTIDRSAGISLLSGVHVGCFELRASGAIRGISDLKGKNVGIRGLVESEHLFLAVMATQVGIDPTKDIHWVIDQPSRLVELFTGGKIDAFLAFPPDTQDLSARRIGNVVVKSASDRPWSQYFCCMLAGNRDFMREHPIATKHVVRALLKAADICVTDPARVARILVDGGFTPRYDYALQMLSELPYDKWREYDPEDTIRFYALRLREAGLIKSSPQKIISDGTDWRFLNELKRELKA